MSIITSNNKKRDKNLFFLTKRYKKFVIIVVDITSKRGPFLPDPLCVHRNFLLLPWEYLQDKCKTFDSNTIGEAKKMKSRHNRKIRESVLHINSSQMRVHTDNKSTI